MQLRSLTLHHFRNHAAASWQFPGLTTLIVAPNASGKTSILEAIQLLATGESFRADKVEEMISFDQELSRVTGTVYADVAVGKEVSQVDEKNLSEETHLEILLTRGLVQGKRTQSRLYSVNTVRRRKKDTVGILTTVSFRPEDMRLMEGSPARRRTFMDVPLSMVIPSYATAVSTYEQALKRRNKILESVRENEMPRTVLTFWNQQLVKHGTEIQQQRRQFLEYFKTVSFPQRFLVEYLPSLITADRQAEYLEREIASGHTLIGPHKDDFQVLLDARSLATYGSRGQQRMGVLWLKICELQFLHHQTHQMPLLLLDDILSELDEEAHVRVLHLLGTAQAVITTTDEKIVTEVQRVVPDAQMIKLG